MTERRWWRVGGSATSGLGSRTERRWWRVGGSATSGLGSRTERRHVADERLSAFLDDELDDDGALRITRHLRRCHGCLDDLEELRSTRDALRRLPGLHAPVLTAEVRAGRPSARRVSRTAVVTGAVSVVIVLLGGTVYALGGDAGTVEPPVDMFLVDHVARTGGGPVPPPVGDSGR